MIILVLPLCLVGVLGAEYTLPGKCSSVIKLQDNFDPDRFSGLWYNVASYASDGVEINDCCTLDFQNDDQGYIFKETYVEIDQGNRTQKVYQARVDPTFDAGDGNKNLMMSHKFEDKVIQHPFFILSTDYDGYAVAYTCKWLKNELKHYVYTWVLTRGKEKLQGELLKKVEDTLSIYTELAEHRQSFVFKDFSDSSCAYTQQLEVDFLDSNFRF